MPAAARLGRQHTTSPGRSLTRHWRSCAGFMSCIYSIRLPKLACCVISFGTRVGQWAATGCDPDAADGHQGCVSSATDLPTTSCPSYLSLSSAPADYHTAESGVGRRYHLYSDAAWSGVSVCHLRLDPSPGSGLVAVQYTDHGFLPRVGAGRLHPVRPLGDLQCGQRLPIDESGNCWVPTDSR